jgi:hypothetical protein
MFLPVENRKKTFLFLLFNDSELILVTTFLRIRFGIANKENTIEEIMEY